MPWTQADIDALRLELRSGVEEIRSGDRSTRFSKYSDRVALLREMEQEVFGSAGTPMIRHLRMSTGSGHE